MTTLSRKSRLVFVYFCTFFLFLILISRLFFIVINGDHVKVSTLYDPNNKKSRSNIYDRNDVLIAADLKTKSLYIKGALVKDSSSVFEGLSKIFPDLKRSTITGKVNRAKRRKGWTLLRRNLTPIEVQKVQDLHIAGLIFEEDLARIYLQKEMTSPIVGYTDSDRHGISGIEMQYDEDLRGSKKDTILALDIRIQDILQSELDKGMKESRAKAAAGIVMDVRNGEILALASLPSFDPNLSQQASHSQRFNRVITGAYELGSVFKIFTNAIALEHDLVKKSDVFNVKEPIKYGKYTIHDDHFVKDKLTFSEVFAYSSNIGTVKIADRIGIDRQKDFFKDLGFLKRLDLDFPGAGRPLYPRIWRQINLYTISYGHGIAVTPLHLATGVAAMVNGGMIYEPSFVKLDSKPKGKRIISEETSKKLREMLRQVVEEGTGKNANIVGYEVGGKTGTAETAESGSYNRKQTMSSFVGVFPISEPKYLVYVLLDRSDVRFNTGGMVAAPIAGKIIGGIAPLLGVYPKHEKN